VIAISHLHTSTPAPITEDVGAAVDEYDRYENHQGTDKAVIRYRKIANPSERYLFT
jgi:hypothetical protein